MFLKVHENIPFRHPNFETYTHMNTWTHVYAALIGFYPFCFTNHCWNSPKTWTILNNLYLCKREFYSSLVWPPKSIYPVFKLCSMNILYFYHYAGIMLVDWWTLTHKMLLPGYVVNIWSVIGHKMLLKNSHDSQKLAGQNSQLMSLQDLNLQLGLSNGKDVMASDKANK